MTTYTLGILVTDDQTHGIEKQFTVPSTERPAGLSLDEWDDLAWMVKEHADEHHTVSDYSVSEFTQLEATVVDGDIAAVREK